MILDFSFYFMFVILHAAIVFNPKQLNVFSVAVSMEEYIKLCDLWPTSNITNTFLWTNLIHIFRWLPFFFFSSVDVNIETISFKLNVLTNSKRFFLLSSFKAKSCGTAGEILNGQFTYTGVEFGDTATAACDKGWDSTTQFKLFFYTDCC